MFLFFRILFIFFLTCTSARADGSTTIQELKLPEYYVGHWTAAAIRAGDFSYFLGCHGTGEARYNFGKKEKFQDISYRVLSTDGEKVLLFIRTLDSKSSCQSVCRKKDEKCVHICLQPSYTYWLLSPSDSYGSQFKMMRIVDYDEPLFENATNPFELPAPLLKKAFSNLRRVATLAYHFKSSIPCPDK